MSGYLNFIIKQQKCDTKVVSIEALLNSGNAILALRYYIDLLKVFKNTDFRIEDSDNNSLCGDEDLGDLEDVESMILLSGDELKFAFCDDDIVDYADL